MMKEDSFRSWFNKQKIKSIQILLSYYQNLVAIIFTKEITKNIIKVVSEDQNSGSLTIQDFEEYEVKVREPICQFIFSYKICGMSAPSSW